MKTIIMLLAALILSGCAAAPQYTIMQTEYYKRLFLVEDAGAVCLEKFGLENAAACATWGPGWCNVYISEADYPRYAGHEERHCVEGHFHRR